MDKKYIQIIVDFIEGTPLWVSQMKKQQGFWGDGENECCPYCGVSPEKMLELSKALEYMANKKS